MFESRLKELGVQSDDDLSRLGKMPPDQQLRVLRFLALLAFDAQNTVNIQLGRSALQQVPKECLLKQFDRLMQPYFAREDVWEYRGVAEFLAGYDAAALEQHLQHCAQHESPEIREIASEWLKPAQEE